MTTATNIKENADDIYADAKQINESRANDEVIEAEAEEKTEEAQDSAE